MTLWSHIAFHSTHTGIIQWKEHGCWAQNHRALNSTISSLTNSVSFITKIREIILLTLTELHNRVPLWQSIRDMLLLNFLFGE